MLFVFHISGFIALLGFAGNAFVVTIITTSRNRGQKSPVQLFVLHLAVSDLFVCLLCIPLTVLMNFYFPENVTNLEHVLCKITRFVQVSLIIKCHRHHHHRHHH